MTSATLEHGARVRRIAVMAALKVVAGLSLTVFVTLASGQSGSPPVRWQAQYTQIYADNIETLQPAVRPGFVLDRAGSLTSDPAEVISGRRSIKGSYFGTDSYTPYLHTDAVLLPLTPGRSYQVNFRYRILTTPNIGFEVLFYSPTGGAAGNFLPSFTIKGAAGASGTATLTNILGPYTDYQARWNVVGTGAIAIDEIQLIDGSTSRVIASEDGEATLPSVGTGLRLQNGATVVTDPSLVIGGSASVALSNFGNIATDPAVVPLAGNTTYIVEFQYRMVNPGTELGKGILNLWLHPAGVPFNQQLVVQIEQPLRNSAATGTYSAGAQTAGAASWVLNISATASSSVIVNNIKVLRQDATATGVAPSNWAALATRPFPRIGRYIFADPNDTAAYPLDGISSLTYTQAELEKRLAFADVIVGPIMWNQTQAPGFARTIRQLNPNAVLLPYRIGEEQVATLPVPSFSNIDLDYSFLQTVVADWYVRDTKGNYVEETDFPGIRLMNISPFCPVVNGQTFHGAMLNWLNSSIFTSGIWDGVFFDNLFGRINPHILNSSNPSLLDYDWNRNGIRDETPASSSEMTRAGAGRMLQGLRAKPAGSNSWLATQARFPSSASHRT
jgi:hypothetical protein